MLTYIRSWTGHIGRQPLQDVIFEHNSPGGLFTTISAFHDWFSIPNLLRHRAQVHPLRSELRDADGEPITFTHGDLHRSNILVSSTGPPKILALIDWHQSGWLPAYWEFCKARWTTRIGDEWEVKYLPKIMQPCEQYKYWDYFVLQLGK
jgi:hypothetical protein